MNPIHWAKHIALASVLLLAPAFSAESPDGGTVQHQSFNPDDHTVYNLRKFNGKYTALLISQTTLDKLGIARVRKAIDEQDIIYSAFKTYLGGEPVGTGLMQVAVYEGASCTAACAQNIGWKSIEVNSAFFEWPDYEHYIIHEFAHAFDFYTPDLFVNFDGIPPGHAW